MTAGPRELTTADTDAVADLRSKSADSELRDPHSSDGRDQRQADTQEET